MRRVKLPGHEDDAPRGGVVTIGNFDGVHRGHRLLVGEAVARARELAVPAVAVTFDPHPERVLRPQSGLIPLTTADQRAELLARLGVDVLVEIAFTRGFATTSAEEFAERILFATLAPREVRIGSNFRFGAGRRGDLTFLSACGERLGFAVLGVEPVTDGGEAISSTRVRRAVSHGEIAEARRLLGRPYFVDGIVEVGEGIGRTLGFPTLNIATANELLPKRGVYTTIVQIADSDEVIPAVSNFGVRPTLARGDREVLEAHLLDQRLDAYGRDVRIFFVARLRDEMAFADEGELVAQIRRDVHRARAHFASEGVPAGELVLR